MKTSNLWLLVMGMIMLSFGCTENPFLPSPEDDMPLKQNACLKSAKKPASNLVGDTDVPFTMTPPTFWNGTVDFGSQGVFGLTFFSEGEPRDYSQASPYNETWVIYYEGTDYNDPANVVMRGWNKGVVTYANKMPDPINFLANGEVMEAYGPFEEWEGCNFHIKGLVYLVIPGLPEKAVGQIRIN